MQSIYDQFTHVQSTLLEEKEEEDEEILTGSMRHSGKWKMENRKKSNHESREKQRECCESLYHLISHIEWLMSL